GRKSSRAATRPRRFGRGFGGAAFTSRFALVRAAEKRWKRNADRARSMRWRLGRGVFSRRWTHVQSARPLGQALVPWHAASGHARSADRLRPQQGRSGEELGLGTLAGRLRLVSGECPPDRVAYA